MRVTVCQNPPDLVPGTTQWNQFAREVSGQQPDFLLLNEMPFGRWISALPEPDQPLFEQAAELHEQAVSRFQQLEATRVLGSRPKVENGANINQAFAWSREEGLTPVHTKQYFPEEEGFYEARWFDRGSLSYQVQEFEGLRIGFMICTDVMFNEWARHYRRQGAHIIAVPRAVGPATLERWKTAMKMAAIVSGCYVISSNRAGTDAYGQPFGGCGWIFHPNGDMLAETSHRQPVLSADVDVAEVEKARQDYPCYVKELSEELSK